MWFVSFGNCLSHRTRTAGLLQIASKPSHHSFNGDKRCEGGCQMVSWDQHHKIWENVICEFCMMIHVNRHIVTACLSQFASKLYQVVTYCVREGARRFAKILAHAIMKICDLYTCIAVHHVRLNSLCSKPFRVDCCMVSSVPIICNEIGVIIFGQYGSWGPGGDNADFEIDAKLNFWRNSTASLFHITEFGSYCDHLQ